ncbi:hypothetical protein [Longirhabdus pacifica]|uniref:hypothetical protein n=1 Tax=Longirhabdus pacifica TaxID=2305227 RepID=UPI001008E61A|nr:hypothetical protein [Longirhabdus pacifica]
MDKRYKLTDSNGYYKKIIIPLDSKLVPSLKKTLNSNGYDWIDNILNYLVIHLSNSAIVQLHDDLEKNLYYTDPIILDYNIKETITKI